MKKKIALRLFRTTLRTIDSPRMADIRGGGPGISKGAFDTDCCGLLSDECGNTMEAPE